MISLRGTTELNRPTCISFVYQQDTSLHKSYCTSLSSYGGKYSTDLRSIKSVKRTVVNTSCYNGKTKHYDKPLLIFVT